MIHLSKTFDSIKHAEARNDVTTRPWLRTKELTTAIEQDLWWRQGIKEDQSYYTLEDNETNDVVGMVGFTSITPHQAEFSCLVYPQHRKKGYGKEGLTQLFNYGFMALNLQQIYGYTYGFTYGLVDDVMSGSMRSHVVTAPPLGKIEINQAYTLFEKLGMEAYGPCLYPDKDPDAGGRYVWRLQLQRYQWLKA